MKITKRSPIRKNVESAEVYEGTKGKSPFDLNRYPKQIEVDDIYYLRLYVTSKVIMYVLYWVSTMDAFGIMYCWETPDDAHTIELTKLPFVTAYNQAMEFVDKNCENPKFNTIAK